MTSRQLSIWCIRVAFFLHWRWVGYIKLYEIQLVSYYITKQLADNNNYARQCTQIMGLYIYICTLTSIILTVGVGAHPAWKWIMHDHELFLRLRSQAYGFSQDWNTLIKYYIFSRFVLIEFRCFCRFWAFVLWPAHRRRWNRTITNICGPCARSSTSPNPNPRPYP